jgi:hypothetical protein
MRVRAPKNQPYGVATVPARALARKIESPKVHLETDA